MSQIIIVFGICPNLKRLTLRNGTVEHLNVFNKNKEYVT